MRSLQRSHVGHVSTCRSDSPLNNAHYMRLCWRTIAYLGLPKAEVEAGETLTVPRIRHNRLQSLNCLDPRAVVDVLAGIGVGVGGRLE